MKKCIFYLIIASLCFLSCGHKKENPIETSYNGVTVGAIILGPCYHVENEPEYTLLCFEKSVGHDFESAYNSIKPDIDEEIHNLAKWIEKYNHETEYDKSRIIIKQRQINVINAPKDDLIFTSFDIYVYDYNIDDYKRLYGYWRVLDSEGNLYLFSELPD